MLLARLNEVLDKHHDNNVLLALSKVYAIFCDENSSMLLKRNLLKIGARIAIKCFCFK